MDLAWFDPILKAQKVPARIYPGGFAALIGEPSINGSKYQVVSVFQNQPMRSVPNQHVGLLLSTLFRGAHQDR